MRTALESQVRTLKVWAYLAPVLGALLLAAAQGPARAATFEEITAKRVSIVDASGKVRVLLAADYKADNSAGVYFFNHEGTEAGALAYNGKRREDGTIEAYSILTMDQFKSDEVVRLFHDQAGATKRQGLTISDMPDSLTARARQVLAELTAALQAAETSEERRAARQAHLARVPGREIGARRVFVGRDAEGASLVTLADLDGKPRLRLQVDKLGNASIAFLDESGRVIRTLTP
jgi:hypothetical protein